MSEKRKNDDIEKRKNEAVSGSRRFLIGVMVVILVLGVAGVTLRPRWTPGPESTVEPRREITREVIPTLLIETTAEPMTAP